MLPERWEIVVANDGQYFDWYKNLFSYLNKAIFLAKKRTELSEFPNLQSLQWAKILQWKIFAIHKFYTVGLAVRYSNEYKNSQICWFDVKSDAFAHFSFAHVVSKIIILCLCHFGNANIITDKWTKMNSPTMVQSLFGFHLFWLQFHTQWRQCKL